jgi:hypothetical protein
MDKDKFKDLIEAPTNYAKSSFLRSLIVRTVRLTLQYPELAQEYLNSLPKATTNLNIY